jgi:hypothetical protein
MSLGLMAGGTLLSANAAGRTKRQLEAIANTPGVNVGEVVGGSLREASGNIPAASRLARDAAFADQGNLDALLELSIPGWKQMRSDRAGAAGSLIRGELPSDVAALVNRQAAARSVGGGYGGSGAGRNLALRDLGLTSLQGMQMGGDMLDRITAGPRAGLATTGSLLGPGPSEIVNLRSGERAQKMQAQTTAAMAPSKTQVWGAGLQQMGQEMMDLIGSVGGIAAGGAM